MNPPPTVSLSVVSHGQGALVATLLDDLAQPEWNEGVPFEVIVTLNIPEDDAWLTRPYPFAVQVLRNEAPKGFGSNHNGAFGLAKGQFFAVVNPDIRLADFRLSALLAALQEPCAGACAPLVKAPDGTIEDSARRFPTVSRLLRRKLLPRRAPDYRPQSAALPVDWVAGMFLLFPSSIYKLIAGFDERYFMYLEDVEICRNLRRCGFLVLWVGSTAVIHDASRASRRNLRHLGWHVTSAFRYLFGSPRGLPLPEIAAARDGH